MRRFMTVHLVARGRRRHVFTLQFGIGWMIGFWPHDPSGAYPEAAHWWTLLAQLVLQALAFVWFFLAPLVLPLFILGGGHARL